MQMQRQLSILGLLASLALPLTAAAQNFADVATISATMGVVSTRLCIGEASRQDIGCPNYAPSVFSSGLLSTTNISATNISATGNIQAAYFIGDGSGLTGVTGNSTDRITSSTTAAVIANQSGGTVSFTLGGTPQAAYLHPSMGLVASAVSTTGNGNFMNINLPLAPDGTTNGQLQLGGTRALHFFKAVGSDGNNTFLGQYSGNTTMAIAGQAYHATNNTGVGYSNLIALTTGYGNTALGYISLGGTTSGYYNTALGANSFYANTTGVANVGVGSSSGVANTTGFYNTTIGHASLGRNATGSYNTAVGGQALYGVTNGDITGNTALGFAAGVSIENGASYNTLLGYYAAPSLTTGVSNIILGANTALGLSAGSNNTIIGNFIPGLTAGLSNNIIIADGAGNRRINIDSAGNMGIGTITPTATLEVSSTNGAIFRSASDRVLTFDSLRSGAHDFSFHHDAYRIYFYNETTASVGWALTNQNAIGVGTVNPASSLTVVAGEIQTATSGAACTAPLAGAMRYSGGTLTYCNSSAWVGLSSSTIAGLNDLNDASKDLTNLNLAVGSEMAVLANNDYNTAIGLYTLGNLSNSAGANEGDANTAVGYATLNTNTTGYYNTGAGHLALYSNTTGYGNNAVGVQALYNNTTGYVNNAFGTTSLYSNTTGIYNTALGHSSLYYNTTGNYNTALGGLAQQGTAAYNAIGNTGVGYAANFSLATGGNGNTSVGYSAGYDITTGVQNLAFGYNTGRGITTGSNNTILGANVTGLAAGLNNNIIIADGAGNRRINIDSAGLIALGTTTFSPNHRLTVETYGGRGIFISNTASGGIGMQVAAPGNSYIDWLDTTGATNAKYTRIGSVGGNILFEKVNDAYTSAAELMRITNGGSVGIGTPAPTASLTIVGGEIQTATSGAACTAPLAGAMRYSGGTLTYCNSSAWVGLSSSTIAGLNDLNDASKDLTNGNIFLGAKPGVLANNFGNSAVGIYALDSLSNSATGTEGDNNTAMGLGALTANTTGYFNTGIGSSALYVNTAGAYNTATGLNTLYYQTGSFNTAFGTQALQGTSSYASTGNTAVGYAAHYSAAGGNYNSSFGGQAGYDLTTGIQNVMLGYNTGRGVTTGSNNTILGANVTGLAAGLSNNIIIADGAGNRRINVNSNGNVGVANTNPQAALDVSGSVLVNGAFTLTSQNAQITLFGESPWAQKWAVGSSGAASTDDFIIYDYEASAARLMIDDDTGQTGLNGIADASYGLRVYGGGVGAAGAYTNTSDARLKTNIQPLTYGLATVMQLNPVGFNWKDQTQAWQKPHQIGFLAQQVQPLIPEVVVTSADPSKTLSLAYGALVPVTVKAIQELKAENDALKANLQRLEARLNALEARP